MATTTQKKTSTAKKSGAKAAPSKTKTETSTSRKKAEETPVTIPPRKPRSVLWGVICLFLGIFCFIGYFNVDALLVNPICGFLKGLIGYGYYALPVALLAAGLLLVMWREDMTAGRAWCLIAAPVVLGALIHVVAASDVLKGAEGFGGVVAALYESGRVFRSGGVIAGLLGWGMKKLLSIFLALPLLFFGLVALLMAAFRVTPKMLADGLRQRRARYAEIGELDDDAEERPVLRRQDAATEAAAAARVQQQSIRNYRHAIDVPMDIDDAPAEEYVEKRVGFFNANPRVKTPAQLLEQEAAAQSAAAQTAAARTVQEPEPVPETESEPVPAASENVHSPFGLNQKRSLTERRKTPPAEPAPEPKAEIEPMTMEEAADIAGVTLQATPSDPVRVEEFSTEVVRNMRSNAKKGVDAAELAEATESVAKAVEEKDALLAGEPAYRFPPVTLLRAGAGGGPDGREEMRLNSERLQSTLDSFGVNAAICDVTRGPTVTRYDLELEAGVKLAKLTNLAGDLALALGVTGVRIAPIPDKISTVGVEVPNKIVSMVYLRDIIDTDTFRNASSRLTVALGKDIGGNAVVGNISKLPHLLIAGTTGSGKSVCMNCLILSLLYKATPEEVRLIMIDPKMVELGIYNGIPHLYIPVVTDPKKAAGSLQWSVVEMLKRYRLFSEAGIRDLAGYNAIQKKKGEPTLPQVVIVIDELADLMMVASKEVEESICRVAQMGRAAGMHLVIATQRPSADVITGLMKANIPSRIAFAVSSGIESRIILDQQGAEKLVGNGDMLFAPIGIGKPNRIQGAFVSDEEREEIVNFIKAQGEASYSEEILYSIEQAAAEKDKDKGGSAKAESVDEPEAGGQYDELLPQAVDVIFETKQASVSMLQRRLKLGYSRAARIVDQMEEIGVVGPFEGSKPRQILITREQWLEMQTVQGTAPTEKTDAVPDFADYEDAPPEEWDE